MRTILLLSLSIGAVLSSTAHADLITLEAMDSGWYLDTGRHSANNINYAAGWYPVSSTQSELRNWFVFDLSGVSGQIVSAELLLFTPLYESSDPSETYELFDVTTDVNTLRASHSAGDAEGLGIFNDLGSGTTFGSRVVTAQDIMTDFTVALNASAIADLNNAGSTWAVGGAISTLSRGTQNEALFIYPAGSTVEFRPGRLSLVTAPAAVPEPSSFILLGLASVCLAGRNLRRSKSALPSS